MYIPNAYFWDVRVDSTLKNTEYGIVNHSRAMYFSAFHQCFFLSNQTKKQHGSISFFSQTEIPDVGAASE